MTDGTFVEELAKKLPRPEIQQDRIFLPANWAEAKPTPLPSPETLCLGTLTGLRDYLREDVDDLNQPELMLHVVNSRWVKLIQKLEGEDKQFRRAVIAQTSAPEVAFKFGEWIEAEPFVIQVQTQFIATPERDEMLKLASSIKDVQSTVAEDDGFSQEVTAKAGAAFVNRIAVKNPVVLVPFRTFREIEQPASAFVLRLKMREGSPAMCALFECDGGNWKLDAIALIGEWLRHELPSMAVIA